MFRPGLSVRGPIAASLAMSTLVFAAGCSGSSEQPILNQFFTASRLRDNTCRSSRTPAAP
jgi:hypothetical protein